MHILLDESVPARLAAHLVGHSTSTVQRQGWASVKNGRLLALAASVGFDVVLTADKGMAHQQNLVMLPVAILNMLARSNRLDDLAPVVPNVLAALANMAPRTLQQVAA